MTTEDVICLIHQSIIFTKINNNNNNNKHCYWLGLCESNVLLLLLLLLLFIIRGHLCSLHVCVVGSSSLGRWSPLVVDDLLMMADCH